MLDSVVCFGSNGDVVVIECVGYVFWVCVCVVLIHECCWGCPGAGFDGIMVLRIFICSFGSFRACSSWVSSSARFALLMAFLCRFLYFLCPRSVFVLLGFRMLR